VQIVSTCVTYFFSCTAGCWKASRTQKILILLQFGNGLHHVKIPAKANVGELRRAVSKKLRASHHVINMQLCGKLLRDDSTSLEASGLITGSTVHCDLLPLCGGGGFKCIQVENLNPLLHTIKADYELSNNKNGNQKEWSGLSNDAQAFFKNENIDPTIKYSQFYTNCRHTIATSYVWSATKLFEMAGHCKDA
jgi:hypothetical protein